MDKLAKVFAHQQDNISCLKTVLYIVEQRKTNLMPLIFFISLFNAQHVSDVNTAILRRFRLIC